MRQTLRRTAGTFDLDREVQGTLHVSQRCRLGAASSQSNGGSLGSLEALVSPSEGPFPGGCSGTGSPARYAPSVIGVLLRFRHVTFAATVVLLIGLAFRQERELRAVDQLVLRRRRSLHAGLSEGGRRRSATTISSSWSTTIPTCSTPGAGPRGRAGRRGCAERIPGVQRVESLDAHAAALGRSTTRCSRSTACRRLAQDWRWAPRRAVKNIDLKTNAMTVAGRSGRGREPAALAALKDRLTNHPLFLGTLIDSTGRRRPWWSRLRKTHSTT